jgi:hypothetical protein
MIFEGRNELSSINVYEFAIEVGKLVRGDK